MICESQACTAKRLELSRGLTFKQPSVSLTTLFISEAACRVCRGSSIKRQFNERTQGSVAERNFSLPEMIARRRDTLKGILHACMIEEATRNAALVTVICYE